MLLIILPLIPFMLIVSMLAVRFWSKAIIIALVWALFEGAVRKWLLPSLQSPLLLVKDIILMFAYIGYFISANRNTEMGPKSGTLLLLLALEAVYCAVQLINPNSPSVLLSFFGLKNYLIYLPLAFILPEMITKKEQLRKAMLAVCLLSIPIGALGLYQFSQPPTSWVNQYVSHEEGVEAIVSTFGDSSDEEFSGGRARTSSTFSYIGGFMTFLLLAVPLALSLLLASVVKKRAWLIVAGALVVSLGAAATTGARTPMFIYAAAAPLMLLIGGAKGLLPLQTALRFALGLALLVTISLTTFGSAFSALEYRANNSDNPIMRLLSPFTEAVSAAQTSPIIGTGIGTNSNASITIMGGDLPWWLNGYAYEGETSRVMQELGFIGFTLVFLPKVFVIFLVAAHLRRSKDRMIIAVHMACLMFVAPHLLLFTVNNPTGGLLYWTVVGFSIAAYRIDAAAQRRHSEENFYLDQGFPIRDVALA